MASKACKSTAGGKAEARAACSGRGRIGGYGCGSHSEAPSTSERLGRLMDDLSPRNGTAAHAADAGAAILRRVEERDLAQGQASREVGCGLCRARDTARSGS